MLRNENWVIFRLKQERREIWPFGSFLSYFFTFLSCDLWPFVFLISFLLVSIFWFVCSFSLLFLTIFSFSLPLFHAVHPFDFPASLTCANAPSLTYHLCLFTFSPSKIKSIERTWETSPEGWQEFNKNICKILKKKIYTGTAVFIRNKKNSIFRRLALNSIGSGWFVAFIQANQSMRNAMRNKTINEETCEKMKKKIWKKNWHEKYDNGMRFNCCYTVYFLYIAFRNCIWFTYFLCNVRNREPKITNDTKYTKEEFARGQ